MRHLIRVFLLCSLVPGVGCRANAAPPTRPAGASTGTEVAFVHLTSGDVTIRAANAFSFPAEPGIPLLRTDEVAVGIGGFAVVRLTNGYLVRIDEDLALAVADIMLLDAPKSSESFAVQLERLLTREEKEKGERIAGWHARLAGAETIPPQAAAKRTDGEAKERRKTELSSTDGAGDVVSSSPARTEKAKDGDEGEDGPGSGVKTQVAVEDESVRRAPPTSRPSPMEWYTVEGKQRQLMKRPLPALVALKLKDAEWRKCLADHIKALHLNTRKIEIMLRLKEQKVVRIAVGGSLPIPACALKGLEGEKVPEGSRTGWIIFEVPLP